MAEKNDYEGEIPRLELSPVWSILNPKEEDGLKNQLDRMVQKLGSNYPSGVSVDETHGPVYIDERAVLEPGIHIIGPTYIGRSNHSTWGLCSVILLDLFSSRCWS